MADITTPLIQRLIDDMMQTMVEYHGVGLAAPQVHEELRLFVAQVVTDHDDEADAEDGEARPPKLMAVINPEITPVGRTVEEDWEGCLSIPDLRGLVPRYRDIKVRAHDRTGQAGRDPGERVHGADHPARDRPPRRRAVPRPDEVARRA